MTTTTDPAAGAPPAAQPSPAGADERLDAHVQRARAAAEAFRKLADLIWTTGGPKAVQATNEAGQPCIGVGSGNTPVYLHRSADVRMAVVDILISKTFDASITGPAEQTLVVDEPIYDAVVAELERMGARQLNHDERDALAHLAFEGDGRVRFGALGQSCANLAAMGGFGAAGDTVPTTSGTGSEVSPAMVLTVGGAKVTLVDTGIDALTHALEAYVSVGMPRTIPDLGLDAGDFAAARDDLAMAAFVDPSPRTNPRMPLVAELRVLLDAVA